MRLTLRIRTVGCMSLAVLLAGNSIMQRAQAASRREIVDRCKAATALVDLGAVGSGTAFCVKKEGLFLTNLHVVSAKPSADNTVSLLLEPGSEQERAIQARVVNTDRENDLALLYASVEGLTALPLGEADTLFETMDVTAFGFPFGRGLSLDSGASPSISVVSGRVAALRRVEGQLRAVQIDGAINPGQSGGPIVDEEGNVVGVVVSAIPQSNVGFAIPVDTVHQFLDRPGLLIDIPTVDFLARNEPLDLEIGIVTYDDEATPDAAQVEIRRSQTEFETFDAVATTGGFRASVTPVPADPASEALYVCVRNDRAADWYAVDDAPLTVGSRELRLLEIRKIERRTDAVSLIVTNDGRKLAGVIHGWEGIPFDETPAPDLRTAGRIDVHVVGEMTPFVGLRVTALKGGDAVSEYGTLVLLQGAPTAIDPKIWDAFQREVAAHAARLPDAEAELAEASEKLPGLIDEFRNRQEQSPIEWRSPDIVEINSNGGATFTLQDDGSYFVEGNNPPTDDYHIRFRVPFEPANLSAVRLQLIPDSRLPHGGIGRGGYANIVLNEIGLAALADAKTPREVPIVRATADFEQNGYQIHMSIDGDPGTGWALARKQSEPHVGVFEVQPDPALVSSDSTFVLHLRQHYGSQHTMGRFRLTVTSSEHPVFVNPLPDDIEAAAEAAVEKRSDEQQELLAQYLERTDGRLARLRSELNDLRNHPPELPLAAFRPPDDPYLAGPLDVVIEAWIDGKSSLYVGRDRLVWEHESAEKPGWKDAFGKFVLVDGQKWYPQWQANSAAVAGEDRSNPYYLPVGIALWDVEVLSITDAEGGAANPDRGTVSHEHQEVYLKITFDDPANGAGEYRVRLTRRNPILY